MSSAQTTEDAVGGDVPRLELAHWRDAHGIVAGITGRGSDPAQPFDLGLWTAQPVGEVMSRWRAFRRAMVGFPAMVLAHQVHGSTVRWQGAGPTPGLTLQDGADGHATSQPGLLLLVTVADCIPVYLADPGRRAVALLHAGWRGTAGEILERAVEVLRREVGSRPADLIAHAGVGISGAEYEVGAEVMAGVGRPGKGPGPWQLDLREVLVEQARKLGMPEMSVSRHCTARDAASFFSHRRSGGTDGRMVAYLGIPGAG